MTQAVCIDDRVAEVGECPVWDAARGLLWWVDIYGGVVFGLDPARGVRRSRRLEGHRLAAALAPCADGRLLVGTEHGLHLLDPDSGALAFAGDPRGGRDWLAFNDARVDPHGALWIGTYDSRFVEGSPGGREGVLFRIGPDGAAGEPWSGVPVVNGPAFAPDGSRIYVADTMAGTILAAPLDAGGLAGPFVPVAASAGAGGRPDGLAVDAAGCLWAAMWVGGRVVRYRPSGEIERIVALPVAMTLSCTFGGPGRTTLFVATATDGLDAAARAAQPLAGRLFAVETDVAGQPERGFPASLLG